MTPVDFQVSTNDLLSKQLMVLNLGIKASGEQSYYQLGKSPNRKNNNSM
jgi:hypothetical protein